MSAQSLSTPPLPQRMNELDRSSSGNSHHSLRFDDCHPVKTARMMQIKKAAIQRSDRMHHESALREELMEELHKAQRIKKRTRLERNLGRQELLDDIREAALCRMELARERYARHHELLKELEKAQAYRRRVKLERNLGRKELLEDIKEAANFRRDCLRDQSQQRRMIYRDLLRHFARRNKNAAVTRRLDENRRALLLQLKQQHTRFYYRRQLTPKSDEERKAHLLEVQRQSVRRYMRLMVKNLHHKRLLIELVHKANIRNERATAAQQQAAAPLVAKEHKLVLNHKRQPNKSIRNRTVPSSTIYQRRQAEWTRKSSFSAMAA